MATKISDMKMNNILVVDDEKVIRANFCEILRMEGFTTIEASSGDEAQERFFSLSLL